MSIDLSNSYLYTVIVRERHNMGVYRIYKWGFEILWCEYLWVATSPCGGYGGPLPRKFRNMKCSRSDSMTILGLLRVTWPLTLCSESNIFFID